MSEESSITDFDNLTFSHPLQLLKAALPYMDAQQQRSLTIGIKMMELRNALSLIQEDNNQLSACCDTSDDNQALNMLGHIRQFCNEREREWIDLFMNFSQAFQLYASYRASTPDGGSENNMFDMLKGMLTPEQQAAFQSYSQMFSAT